MPSQTFSVTGDGESLFAGGTFTITTVSARITVAGYSTQFRSGGVPRRVMHAGWVALGSLSGTTPTRFVSWFSYLDFDGQYFQVSPSQAVDRIIYSIPAGTTVSVTVYY
jgi:hypothetical protein